MLISVDKFPTRIGGVQLKKMVLFSKKKKGVKNEFWREII